MKLVSLQDETADIAVVLEVADIDSEEVAGNILKADEVKSLGDLAEVVDMVFDQN